MFPFGAILFSKTLPRGRGRKIINSQEQLPSEQEKQAAGQTEMRSALSKMLSSLPKMVKGLAEMLAALALMPSAFGLGKCSLKVGAASLGLVTLCPVWGMGAVKLALRESGRGWSALGLSHLRQTSRAPPPMWA